MVHLAEQVGRVLDGRYRVVAPIGTGASAAVFLADDVVLRRRVAIKVLHAALAGDQSFLRRFQAEAHTAAGLSHPHIMRVLDWGEADDGPFLVLEYLGGGSLRAVLDHSGTISLEQAVGAGLQAAGALEYAHRRGLVHRDIKPANLLFDEEGRLAVADFGLARALAEAAWTEPGGAILGTARYASPEQVRGQPLDGKADVYAFGLMLIEAVCGYVPFTADTTIATLMARVDAQLEAPPEMGPLGPIVESATAPDLKNRIDASELQSMLEEAASQLSPPEPLVLPGAIAVNLAHPLGTDSTMLPGHIEARPSTAVDAVPLPTEPPSSKRLFRRKSRQAALDTIAGGSLVDQSARPGRLRRLGRRLSLRAALLSIGIIALIALLGAGAYGAYFLTGTPKAVPQLDGLTTQAAGAAADAAGVKLRIAEPEFNETVPVGQTFGADPPAGREINSREPVSLRVSKGPAPRQVEDYVGKMINDIRPLLVEKGLNVVSENRPDEAAPVGKILAQNPPGGSLPRGGDIRFVLSGGPAPRTIPDLGGKSYEQAAAAISALQLKPVRSEGFSDSVPAGRVSGTNPRPGAAVARGATVTIIVSKGPDLVAVPDVRGQSLAAANSAISAAGLSAQVFGPAGGTVVTTKPAPGEKVKKGSSVLVYLG